MMDLIKGTVTPKDWAAFAIILGIAVLIAAGFVLVVHSGQKEKLAGTLANNVIVTADLASAQKIASEIDDLRDRAANIEKLVEEFKERLPLEREIPALVREFESIADEVEVTEAKIRQQPSETDSAIKVERIPYSIEATGKFHNVVMFINRLEAHKRYFKISGLDMQPSKEDKRETTALFTLDTYRFITEE